MLVCLTTDGQARYKGGAPTDTEMETEDKQGRSSETSHRNAGAGPGLGPSADDGEAPPLPPPSPPAGTGTVPLVEFIRDVEEFMSRAENRGGAEAVLRRLDQQYSWLAAAEKCMAARRGRLNRQLPNLENSLAMVGRLLRQRERSAGTALEMLFFMSEQLYVKAEVPRADTVFLWLGANVMLEYPLAEAEAVLRSNLRCARSNAALMDADLACLRDQYTVTEVNMARVYNWNLRRTAARAEAAGT